MPGWARILRAHVPAEARWPWKQAVGAGQRCARPPSPLAPRAAPRVPRGEGALGWAVLQPGVNEKISLNQKSTPLHTCVRASRRAAQRWCRLRCAAPRCRAQRQVLPAIKKKEVVTPSCSNAWKTPGQLSVAQAPVFTACSMEQNAV